MRLDIQALPYQIGYAVAGQTGLAKGIEAIRAAAGMGAESIYAAAPSGEELRRSVEGLGDEFKVVVGKIMEDNTEENRQNLLDMLTQNAEIIKDSTLNTALEALNNFKMEKEERDNSVYKAAMSLVNKIDTSSVDAAKLTEKGSVDKTTTTNVIFDGEIDINVNVPPGTDARELSRYVNTPEFKESFYLMMKEQMDKAVKPVPQKGG